MLHVFFDKNQSVQSSITKYFCDERRTARCEVCKTNKADNEKVKEETVTKAGPFLIICLRRFRGFTKDANPVVISEEISFCTDVYQLESVILHHGTSVESGHYTCVVRSSHEEWLVYNDDRVCH